MKSFLTGKRSLNVSALRSPPAAAALAATAPGTGGPAAPGSGTAPHIDVVKQGDKITRIVVTCACGECTEIECLYPPGQ